MTYSSSLIDDFRPLVLDTSVLINLNACASGFDVLTALPNDIIVPLEVSKELEHEKSHEQGEHGFLQRLIGSGTMELGEMTDEENTLFADLISGAHSLGDGEAATIAIAAKRQLLPVIDDSKGQARFIQVVCGQEPLWSLDLLLHTSVTSALGEVAAIDSLYFALRDGRMRVPTESVKYIIDVLGIDRAKDCTCLPGYRKIFG